MATATVTMTRDEMNLVRGIIGQEIESVRVIDLKGTAPDNSYIQALSKIESKLAA